MLWSGFPGCHDRTWATPCRAWVTLEEVYVPIGAETHPKNISGTSGNKYFVTSKKNISRFFSISPDFHDFFVVFDDFGEAQVPTFSLRDQCVNFLKMGPKIAIGPTWRGSISELRRSWKENWVSRIAYSTSTFAWANFWDGQSKIKLFKSVL